MRTQSKCNDLENIMKLFLKRNGMIATSFSIFQLFLVFWKLPGLQMTIFVSIGSELMLTCPNVEVNLWQYCDSKDVIADCKKEQEKINPNLNVSGRIHITQDCQLIIQNITLKDLTTYLCASDNGNLEEIHVKRRNIQIDGTNNSGVIQGSEGENLTLQCTVLGYLTGDTLYWTKDDTILASDETSSLRYNLQAHRSDNFKEFICMANNSKDTRQLLTSVQLNIVYPPIIWTKDITFNGIKRPRTLKCNVSGEPNTYNFTWRHYTNNNQLVRMFNDSSDGVLILPEGEANDLVFEDSGFYICNVTNGIPDDSGKLWQSRKIKVMVEGRPVLAKPQKSMFFGHFNGTSRMSLFVLSSSNVTQAEWKNENGNSLGHCHCRLTVNKTFFYGKSFDVPGYRCVYQVQNTREEDFKIYTVELENQNGRTTFDISLVSSRAPEVPDITGVYQKQNYIVLEWKPKFDGGATQCFIVQYRKKEDEIWKSILIQSNETKDFFYISNPQPNTEYVLRMFAFNKIGNSSFTLQHIILTDDEKNNDWIEFKFVFLSVAVLLSACLIVLLWRYRQALPDGTATLIKVLQLEMTSIFLLTEMTYIPRLIAAGKF